MPEKKKTSQPAKGAATKSKPAEGFSAAEKSAMKERAKELKAAAKNADMEKDLLDKIAEMKGSDKTMAKRLHEIIKATAPDLVPKTWYGMPAYANKEGKIICFFQSGEKFGSRYATFGFQDSAQLDNGNFWPTSFALTALTPVEEAKIKALMKRAVK